MNKDDIIINVKINVLNDLLNKYNDLLLNSELSNYIFNQCKGEKLNGNVIINIISSNLLSDQDEEKIKDVFKTNFKLIDLEDEMLNKKNRGRSLLLMFIGVIFLFISYFFDGLLIASEVTLIIGWVAIWEVVDYLFFTDNSNRVRSKRIDQLSNAKINFL